MIDTATLLADLKKKICHEIDVESEGLGRVSIYTPFTFNDGDHYVVTLKRDGDDWVITDEGHTLMHLSYADLDLSSGMRSKIIEDSLRAHGIENRDGELLLPVPDEQFGDALFSFVQALSKTCSVTQITREVAKTTFFEDFAKLIRVTIYLTHRSFDELLDVVLKSAA